MGANQLLPTASIQNGLAKAGVPATKRTGPLGQIVLPGTEWDVPLLPGLQKSARAVLQEIVKTQDVVFHRSMGPAGAQGKPELVCLWDGGKPASAGCIYVKYKTGKKTVRGSAIGQQSQGHSIVRCHE